MINPFYIIPRIGGVAYLNIPKAACSSILRALYFLRLGDENQLPEKDIHGFEPDYGHIDYFFRRWPLKFPPLPSSFITFSFVRNPYDRFYSFFKSKVIAGQPPIQLYKKIGLKQGCSFEECVKIITSSDPNELEHHAAPQAMLLSNGHEMNVDFIGKVENLHLDWQIVQKITGYNIEIGKANVTKSSNKPVYSDDLKERIYNYYEDDFVLFGYKKHSVATNSISKEKMQEYKYPHLLNNEKRQDLLQKIKGNNFRIKKLADEYQKNPSLRANHFSNQNELLHELLLKNIHHLESRIDSQETQLKEIKMLLKRQKIH